ncbi:MAG: T9SS type A sorting domain-containing protein, partial [Ignavibacteriaceae bacterium]
TLNSDIPGNNVYGLKIDSEDNIWGMAIDGTSSSYKLFKFDGNGYQSFEMIDRISSQQSLVFDSRGNIVAATPSGLMIYDGTRWIHHISPEPKIGYYLNSVAIDNNDNIWCAFNYGLAKFRDDKWTLYDSLNTFIQSLDGFIFSLDIDSADNKWMGVYNGGIITFNISDIGVHVKTERVENIDKYELNQSYPNPFNSYSIISYTLPEDQHVELKVYDILGNLVTELVNENVSTGYHEISFNAAGLPSGMYFYTIKTERFTETRKIALVK